MPTVRQILVKHDKFLTSVVDAFDAAIAPVLDKARKKTLREIEKKITVDAAGALERTADNQAALQTIKTIFARQFKNAGYNTTVAAFTSQFADHLPVFQDVINSLVDNADKSIPDIVFKAADADVFAAASIDAKTGLLDLVESAGVAARKQALFESAGLPLKDLTELIAKRFATTASLASSVASTSLSVFYRTVADRAYQQIETGLAPGAVRYTYAGPDDDLERDFCANLTGKADSYTRAEIDDMDNGQDIGGVWETCGGWNCRHQWVLSLA